MEAVSAAAAPSLPASFDSLLGYSRTMLLQGPMGPFFRRLADVLRQQGQEVWKVNFNGGDAFFFRGPQALQFREDGEHWPAWLEQRLRELRIDAIVLFGQSRDIHRQAIAVARRLCVAVYVFEEGYLRPNYVTLEPGGVNAASALPRQAEFYLAQAASQPARPTPTRQRFPLMALYATLYSWAMLLQRSRFPHHEYHRPLHPVTQALSWIRGGARKLWYGWSERNALQRLSAPALDRQWFLVPLQVHNDSQIHYHSPYRSIPAVIEEVMYSFALHAPRHQHLVFKHHPMDRAYCDFGRFIADKARELEVEDRVHYVHDVHLPSLLKHARGVVTVNSTSGLQALYHGTPVHTLGDCLYDIPGLVHQGTLADFWHQPGSVDHELYLRFRAHLVRQTQLNASFYADTPAFEQLQRMAEARTAYLAHVRRMAHRTSEARPARSFEPTDRPSASPPARPMAGLPATERAYTSSD
ncbi:capsular biosynthesis protein [uncultured Azohydromonas sp.]|uniref:capsule biosynthesis protein n=1 Tax=uncultured Azohydromonas sp. TaxID=487342 RepID=UPI00261B9972|nr:capsular biosynthesis protein [uncultured Azohydromonas sp.]